MSHSPLQLRSNTTPQCKFVITALYVIPSYCPKGFFFLLHPKLCSSTRELQKCLGLHLACRCTICFVRVSGFEAGLAVFTFYMFVRQLRSLQIASNCSPFLCRQGLELCFFYFSLVQPSEDCLRVLFLGEIGEYYTKHVSCNPAAFHKRIIFVLIVNYPNL